MNSTDVHKPKAGEEKAASDEGNAKENKGDVPTDEKGTASCGAHGAGDAGGVQLAVLPVWLRPFKKEKYMTKDHVRDCLLYTSPSPRDLSTSRMPSSA